MACFHDTQLEKALQPSLFFSPTTKKDNRHLSKLKLTVLNHSYVVQLLSHQKPKIHKTLVNSVISTLQNTSSRQKVIMYPHTSTYSSFFLEPNRSEKIMFFLLIQHVLVLSQTQKIESNKSFHIYWGSHEAVLSHAASVNRYLKAKLYMCNIKLSWNNLLKPLCKFIACKRTQDWS